MSGGPLLKGFARPCGGACPAWLGFLLGAHFVLVPKIGKMLQVNLLPVKCVKAIPHGLYLLVRGKTCDISSELLQCSLPLSWRCGSRWHMLACNGPKNGFSPIQKVEGGQFRPLSQAVDQEPCEQVIPTLALTQGIGCLSL